MNPATPGSRSTPPLPSAPPEPPVRAPGPRWRSRAAAGAPEANPPSHDGLEDSAQSGEAFDTLTDLFLGEIRRPEPGAEPAGRAEAALKPPAEPRPTGTPIRRAPSPEPARRTRVLTPTVECLVLGHLPVLASAWAGQYVRQVAMTEAVSVAFMRVQAGYATIEIVGGPRDGAEDGTLHHAPEALTIEAAIAYAAQVTGRWVVRVEDLEEHVLACRPIVRLITLLTSADEAAVVAAYRTLKLVCARLPQAPGGAGEPNLHVAVIGAAPDWAAAVGAKLADATQTFLGRRLNTSVASPRIQSGRAPTLVFSGRIAEDAAGVVDILERTITKAARSAEAVPTGRPAIAPEPVAPAATAEAPVEARAELPGTTPPVPLDDPPPRPSSDDAAQGGPAEEPLAGHVAGLRVLAVRCPYAESVQFAIDQAGRPHALAGTEDQDSEPAIRSLLVASAWLGAHAALLSALPGVGRALDPHRAPVLHLFTATPKSVRRLLDADLRVHLLARVEVDGRTGWCCADLN